MGQQVNVYKSLNLMPGAIVTGSWNGAFDRGGRTYYVNNITGNASADGLSWNSAVKEVSDAITLSEAFRELQASTNERIRNTIVVQGTDTSYVGLTDLGEEYNLIGLAAPTGGRGHLTGATIGNTTTNGLYAATGDYTGVYVSNIQFAAATSNYPAFSVLTIDQSVFEDCGFYEDYYASQQCTDGFLINSSGGADGLVLRRCVIGGNNANSVSRPIDGFHNAGLIFRNSLVEDCLISGSTKAFHLATSIWSGGTTVIRNNLIGEVGHGTCTYGIYDDTEREIGTGDYVTYYNNFLQALTEIACHFSTIHRSRFIMNYGEQAVLVEADFYNIP